MLLLKIYLDTFYFVKSILYILFFPLHVLRFYIVHLFTSFWLFLLSISWIQRLQCPRFGTNFFSRFGRLVVSYFNVHLVFGGALAGVAILFVLYHPVLHRFDREYYVIFQRPTISIAYAAQSTANDSALLTEQIAVLPHTFDGAPIVGTAMPIVTEVAPTPTPIPTPIGASKTLFIQPITLPAGFIPPELQGNTSFYSPLRHPPRLLITTRFSPAHPGIDLATDYGTPIYSVSSGYVESVGSTIWAYGNVVYINHGNGIISLYAHMSRVDVKPGQYVTQDTVIGAVGSTGRSTGPHVHLELRKDGRAFNPLGVLQGL